MESKNNLDIIVESIKRYVKYECNVKAEDAECAPLYGSIKYFEVDNTSGILWKEGKEEDIHLGFGVLVGDKIVKVFLKKDNNCENDFISLLETPIEKNLFINKFIRSYFRTLEGISFKKFHHQNSVETWNDEAFKNVDETANNFVKKYFERYLKDRLEILVLDNDKGFYEKTPPVENEKVLNFKLVDLKGNLNEVLENLKPSAEKLNILIVDLKLFDQAEKILQDTGFEFVKQARNSNDFRFLPIVIYTKHFNEPTIVESLIKVGADWYNAKRTHPEVLIVPVTFLYTTYWLTYLYYFMFFIATVALAEIINMKDPIEMIFKREYIEKCRKFLEIIGKNDKDTPIYIKELKESVFGYKFHFLSFIRENTQKLQKIFDTIADNIEKGVNLKHRKGLIEYFVFDLDKILDDISREAEKIDIKLKKDKSKLKLEFPLLFRTDSDSIQNNESLTLLDIISFFFSNSENSTYSEMLSERIEKELNIHGKVYLINLWRRFFNYLKE